MCPHWQSLLRHFLLAAVAAASAGAAAGALAAALTHSGGELFEPVLLLRHDPEVQKEGRLGVLPVAVK